jgi:hypothetical protein
MTPPLPPGSPSSRHCATLLCVSGYSHLVEGFVLPALAAVFAGGVLAFFFGGLKWSYKKHLAVTVPLIVASFLLAWLVTWLVIGIGAPERRMIVAGTIVDESSNNPIGQALVSLSDGSGQYVSEDNGNFMLDLTGKVQRPGKVRVRVTKEGYSPHDETVSVPTEGFVIALHRP